MRIWRIALKAHYLASSLGAVESVSVTSCWAIGCSGARWRWGRRGRFLQHATRSLLPATHPPPSTRTVSGTRGRPARTPRCTRICRLLRRRRFNGYWNSRLFVEPDATRSSSTGFAIMLKWNCPVIENVYYTTILYKRTSTFWNLCKFAGVSTPIRNLWIWFCLIFTLSVNEKNWEN